MSKQPDWELWFAYMDIPDEEFLAKGGHIFDLDFPPGAMQTLRLAAATIKPRLRVREFVEMAVWERMEELGWYQDGIPRYGAVLSTSGALPCFFCGDPTEWIDVNFEAPFCNSALCNWAIDEDLRMQTVPA